MADSKISLLTALAGANVDGTDVFPIVDVSATTTKKITVDELAIYLGALAAFDVTSLDDVADVTITTVANGDLLKWNGTAWVNAAGYALLASPTFTGTVSGVSKTMVGLGSVDDTADTAKPVSTAQQTALDLKSNLASPTFTGTPTLPTGTVATTQTAANNTTAVATTAFVTTAVAAVAVDYSSDQLVLAGAVFNS